MSELPETRKFVGRVFTLGELLTDQGFKPQDTVMLKEMLPSYLVPVDPECYDIQPMRYRQFVRYVSKRTGFVVNSLFERLFGKELCFSLNGPATARETKIVWPPGTPDYLVALQMSLEMFRDVRPADDMDTEFARLDNETRSYSPHPASEGEEPDIPALVDELRETWAKMRAATPTLSTMSSAAALKLVEDCVTQKQRVIDLCQMNSMLRRTVDLRVSNMGILDTNPHLKALWNDYLKQWLSLNGYDTNAVDFSSNRINNSKGQPMKLTKAIAASTPDILPTSAGLYAMHIAFAKNPPNRDSFIALIATAFRGFVTATITANPSDFMTCSFNGGFNSCHGPGRERFAGNTGFVRSPDVMMAFIGTQNAKTGRMWLHYDHKHTQLLQLKSYGVFPEHLRKPVREFVEDCIVPNGRWLHRANAAFTVMTPGDSFAYFDHSGADAAYLYGNTYVENLSTTYKNGLCVKCAQPKSSVHLNARTSVCNECPAMICDHCGVRIVDRSTAVRANNLTYCHECKDHIPIICYGCGTIVPRTLAGLHMAMIQGVTQMFCPGCRDSRFHVCDVCDGVDFDAFMRDAFSFSRYTSVYVCDGCFDEHVAYCDHCDRNIMITNEDSWDERVGACHDCSDRYFWECDKCHTMVHRDDVRKGMCYDCRANPIHDATVEELDL